MPGQVLDFDDAMTECIDNCNACHTACLELATWALNEGGDLAKPSLIRLLYDCADICRTSADFMTRGSDLHAATCEACAKVCSTAADRLRETGGGEQVNRVVETLKACAGSCRGMADMES